MALRAPLLITSVLLASMAGAAQKVPGSTSVVTARMDDKDTGGGGQKRFEEALRRLREGKAREAAEALMSLARDLPDDDIAPEALFEAAQIYEEQLRDPARGLELYGQLTTRYPDSRLSIRAQHRQEELGVGLKTGAAAYLEFQDILRTGQGREEIIPRLRRLLAEHPEFVLYDRALFVLATALRAIGQLAEAEQTLAQLLRRDPDGEFAPHAVQLQAQILLARREYGAARARFASLSRFSGALWETAAAQGVAACDREARRGRLAIAAIAYLALLGLALGVKGRGALWPPPYEIYYYLPVALFLCAVSIASSGGPVWRAVIMVALLGMPLVWLGGAAARRRPRAATRLLGALALLLGVLARMAAAAAITYLVVYRGGLTEVVLETLRNGPEG